MKLTQIVKGLVKKEEEIKWRINHARSLTQIDIRIRNPNSNLEYSTADLIRDVASYDPSKVNEAQLRDDMRICFAWYSTIKEGYSAIKARVKKYKFGEQDVVSLAKKIYNEIEKRKREGKMKHEWNPDEMKKHSKELFGIISKDKLSQSQTSLLTKENERENNKLSVDVEETLPIYPGSTSDKYEPLELTEFLDKWNSFVIRKPFISLVGSLANWNRTDGDIDILVKARDPTLLLEALDRAIIKLFELKEDALADVLIWVNQFIHTDSLFLNAKWRIERAFPEWTSENRFSILDDSFSGPFTNFVELADLVSVAREEKERQEMSERKLKLFEHFPMLKPLHGRKKEEIYSIDSVIETIKSRKEDWFEIGTFVEIKFDGTHIQCHKQGDVVMLITEDGTAVTKNCPTVAKELLEKAGDWILCGEMELWKEGKHQPRADCAGVLNSKDAHSDEEFLRFNIFDQLWHKGKDLHELPFSGRIGYLDQIVDTEHVKKSKRILCHSEAEVRKAIEKVSKDEGSEGAYLKKADFKYELDGKTLNNIKFKNELTIEAVVLKKNKVAKTEKTFYYHCGLKSDSELVYCGKTGVTNFDATIGQILKVIFVDISAYTDPKTKKRWANWWGPARVAMIRTDRKEPDSIDTAWRMAKQTTGRFEEKKMPDIKHLEQLAAKGKRFVLQHHFRGASVTDRTPIVLRSKGVVSVTPIKDLFSYQESSRADTTEKEIENIDVWTKSGWSPILYVTRHRQNSPLLRVRAIEGIIEVSSDHSLFDSAGSPRPVSSFTAGEKLDLIELPKLKGKISVDPELAWLYGFYLAEGNEKRGKSERYSTIEISSTDLKLLEKAEEIATKYGFHTSIYMSNEATKEYLTGWKLWININIAWMFETSGVHEVAERKARWKIVPSCVYTWNPESQKAFIHGYLDGDGISISPDHVEFGSASQSLAQAMLILVADNYDFPYFRVDAQDSVIRVSMAKEHNLIQERNIIKNIWQSKTRDLHGSSNPGFKNGQFTVKHPERGEWYYSHKRWIYDIETENHDFLAGVGRIRAHNSEHIDFRVQINHVLEGFTIAAQHADILKDELAKHWKLEKSKDVYSLFWGGELAYQLDKKEKITRGPSAALKKKIFDFHVALHKDPKYWKVNSETGEEKKRKGVEKEQVGKIFCVKKGKEPFEWLNIEGVTKPREIEPEPGGTRFYPGVFVIIDEGVYHPGAQKPYFKEYFLEGKKWKGRIVFRLVAGLKGTKAVADWLYWKPDDQSPYILSSRAIKDNWFPDEGSAMPPEWERKLPAELQFWKVDKTKRAEIRKLARKYLLQKKMLSSELTSSEFILTSRNWAGQLVVRGLPFEDYHLKINGKTFHLDKDPAFKVPAVGISALQFEGKEEYFKEGKKQPKTAVNPNVKIPAFIEEIDSGAVEIIADEPLYLHVRFKGKKLKGLYYFRKTSRQSQFWTFKKGMVSF